MTMIDGNSPVRDRRLGGRRSPITGSHLGTLRHLQRIIDLDPEVAHGTLNLCVTE